jgi:hypothetical protein
MFLPKMAFLQAVGMLSFNALAETTPVEPPLPLTTSAGSEYFVLERKKLPHDFWEFFVIPIDKENGRPGDHGMWVKYDPHSPNLMLMANDTDRLAYNTTNPDQTVYIKALKDLEFVRQDDSHLLKLVSNPNWKDRFFGSLDKNMPMTGTHQEEKAKDRTEVCPVHPKKKSNQPCETFEAFELPPLLIKLIRAAAKRNHLDPAVLASLLHAETKFDFWLENQTAKASCDGKVKSEKCSRYGWERGIGQIGTELSKKYGLDWHQATPKPNSCKEPPWNDRCLKELSKLCSKLQAKLKPYNCPGPAIEAAAKRLALGIAEVVKVKQTRNGIVRVINVTKQLRKHAGSPEYSRYLVSAYNRGPRIANSYAEYFRQQERVCQSEGQCHDEGKFPSSYDEAWVTQRDPKFTPSKGSGYQILNGEYINRCYVFSIAGICGDYPDVSLAKQYHHQLTHPGTRQLLVKHPAARKSETETTR